ncbi:GmrSD restriction endonuclease domain-containing protein [Prevotella sp.]|uniref:GmrSD restriction endonuclease domain-containing protein n=1 Tax=Prevotella sp. TaxID=59823 RepID=UPI003DA59AF1
MKTTFYKTFIANEVKHIYVPRLQRDYVQGNNPGVRTNFCQNLISSITGNGIQMMDLNFIYGYDEGNFFIPIDGQQRITTLWILHLYILSRSGLPDIICNLQYCTRDSAMNFCKALKENIGALCHKQKEANLNIKDQNWYFDSWNKDTTVEGIIAVLDYLHEQWRNKKSDFFIFLWKRLSSNNCPITFTFIDNNEEDLNNNIYLKMNSRGRKLSEYELLKSWLDEKLPKNDLQKKWQQKIDGDWTNMVWTHRKAENSSSSTKETIDNIDKEQLRLLYNIIIFYWTLDYLKGESTYTIIRLENVNKVCSFINIKSSEKCDLKDKIRDFQSKLLAKMIVNKDYSIPLYILDSLSITNNEFYQEAYDRYEDIFIYQEYVEQVGCLLETEHDVFYKYFLNSNKTYPDTAISIAIQLFFKNDKSSVTQLNDINFIDWMRVVRNIVRNSTIDSIETFIAAIRLIKELADGSKGINIYEYLAQNKIVSQHAAEQVKEERFKASIIVDKSENIKSKESIQRMEDLPFCSGQILFPLKCVDIDCRNSEHNSGEFKSVIEKFDKLYLVLKQNLCDKDIRADFRRVLFSCGDHKFYTYYGTWSYSLNLWKRTAIRNCGDLGLFKSNDDWMKYLIEAVNAIVEYGTDTAAANVATKQNMDGTPNWIQRLIKEPDLISEYCTKDHFFAVEEDESACYLFKGGQRPKSKEDCFEVR